jgi:uncharacterized protein
MKRAAFSIVLTTILSIVSHAAFAGEPIKWHDDVDSALKDARDSHKPVLVFFTASWCQYCHKMENDTFTNPGIAHQINNDFVPLMVDVDAHKDLVEKYKVDMFPAMLFFGPDGQFHTRSSGYKAVPETGKLLSDARH